MVRLRLVFFFQTKRGKKGGNRGRALEGGAYRGGGGWGGVGGSGGGGGGGFGWPSLKMQGLL